MNNFINLVTWLFLKINYGQWITHCSLTKSITSSLQLYSFLGGWYFKYGVAEAAIQRCSQEKVFWKCCEFLEHFFLRTSLVGCLGSCTPKSISRKRHDQIHKVIYGPHLSKKFFNNRYSNFTRRCRNFFNWIYDQSIKI